MTLSEKLYNLRRKQGLSQEALAEKLNCSRQVISKWENGTTSPDAEMLHKYSELFGVSIDYLVKEEYRKNGYAKELLSACEIWAKEIGCSEFASDCEIDNMDSFKFHMAMGFDEANRIICFKKRL